MKQKIIIAIVLIGLLGWFLVWAALPNHAKLSAPKATNKTPAIVGDKDLNSTYISFRYNGKYLAKNEGPSNNDLEVHTLSADTHYNKQIIASVSTLPDGQLDSYGAYIFRKVRTDLYKARQVKVAGLAAEVWVKNDGSEQTVMIPHGNKVATLAFTTASQMDTLTAEVDALLKTFSWKE